MSCEHNCCTCTQEIPDLHHISVLVEDGEEKTLVDKLPACHRRSGERFVKAKEHPELAKYAMSKEQEQEYGTKKRIAIHSNTKNLVPA